MKAGENNTNRPPLGPGTTAHSAAREWLKRESVRISNIDAVGDSDKVSGQHRAFVKTLTRVLDEHDKLLKYARIVVRCHENQNFEENVRAIRFYLVEDLGVEP